MPPDLPVSASPPKKRPYCEFLSDVDLRFKRLTDNVLPTTPYLLTVPSERPFHLGSRFVSNWAVGDNKLFSKEEEQLQYLTFLSHQNEDTLLVAVGGWSEQDGSIMNEDNSQISRAAGTPGSSVQKKKISLSDYKKKAKETSNSPPAQTPELDGKSRAASATLQAPPAQHVETNGHDAPPLNSKKATSGTVQNQSKDPNRISKKKDKPGGSTPSIPASIPPTRSPRVDSPPPSKKPRLSTTDDIVRNTAKSKSPTPAVPALLSPTLPPTTITRKLPRLLSPTLPSDLEDDLEKLQDGFSSKENSTSKKTLPSKATAGSNGDSVVAKSVEKGRPHSDSLSSSGSRSIDAKNKPSKLSDSSTQSANRNPTADPRPSSPSESQPSRKNLQPSSSIASKTVRNTNSKPKCIVKLKYGRANRKRVEALLKFSGKRSTTPTVKPKGTAESISRKEPANQSHPLKTMESQTSSPQTASREKRLKPSEDNETQEPPSKRQRSSTVNSSSAYKSPSIQQQTVKSKTQFLTPNKDGKSAPMSRVGSGDSEARTPTRVPNTSTPGSAGKSTKLSSPTASNDAHLTKSRESERQAWRDEFSKYVALGRELKHAAQRHSEPDAAKELSSIEKLGAAIAVESILCFILAFNADDRVKVLSRQSGDSQSWRSILAYWNVVKSRTAPYPHLHGLCLLLGAISHDAIHTLDLERLASTSLPSEHSSIPTPGSDGNTVISEENKKFSKEFNDLKTRLLNSHRDARRLWIEGSQHLPYEVLSKQYPTTWSKRSKEVSKEKARPGEYSGDFTLPLDSTATPLEAVRFGLSFLNEWTAQEGVEWNAKLSL